MKQPKFEKYHPLLTANFTLDWLTATPLKTIYQCFQTNKILQKQATNYAATSHYLNRTMLAIMQDQKLVWGITRRADQDFCGIAGFQHLQTSEPELNLILLRADLSDHNYHELLTHLVAFAQNELALPELYFKVDNLKLTQQIMLTQIGFTPCPTAGMWQIVW